MSVAVQMGVNNTDDHLIRSEFSEVSLQTIDAVVFHHLPINHDNLMQVADQGDAEDLGKTRMERVKSYYENWETTITAASTSEGDLELAMTAWTVGAAANSSDDVLLQYQDYGLRAASSAVCLVFNYSLAGVESAHVWGIDVKNLNNLSSAKFGEDFYTPFGVAFEMPLVIVILGMLGVVDAPTLRAKRKVVIVSMAVLAALFTPPDAVSMISLLCPLIVLYEVSILIVATFAPKLEA